LPAWQCTTLRGAVLYLGGTATEVPFAGWRSPCTCYAQRSKFSLPKSVLLQAQNLLDWFYLY
jgi:hypothetical protein